MTSPEAGPGFKITNDEHRQSSAIDNLQILLDQVNPVNTEQPVDPLLDRIIKDLRSLRQKYNQNNDIYSYIGGLGEQDRLLRELYEGQVPPEDPSGISAFRSNLNNVELAKQIHEAIRKANLELSDRMG